ncbi:MAG: hypothetical protein CR997_10685 [Acidobacteria bacterium]|nr:MAG: hypothetical protein CR997_10685 [Acidobacteriota bacterium]
MTIELSSSVLFSQLQYDRVYHHLGQDYSRLSSGLRLESAKDDPSDYAISNQLRAESRLLKQARRNAFDGLGYTQVVENHLNTTTHLLTRATELAAQAASGHVNTEAKAAINAEYQEIISELDRIHAQSEYNNLPIFAPSGRTTHIQFGDTSNETVAITTQPIDAAAFNLNGTDILSEANAEVVFQRASEGIDHTSAQLGILGSKYNRLKDTLTLLDEKIIGTQAAESQLRDADVALEVTKMTSHQIQMEGAKAAMAQANLSPERVLSLFT